MSSTYRQSSNLGPGKRQLDPENVYLSRGPNTRLTAEMIRDNALAISSLLVDSIGGKWVKPYQPKGIWKELANQIGENKYRIGEGSELYRRSLYTYWKRTIPPPSMLTFDASERAVCIVKREATSTPLQSLILLNDPQYVETSKFLAYQMMQNASSQTEEGISYGFRKATSRNPTREELDLLTEMLKQDLNSFSTSENAQLYTDSGEKILEAQTVSDLAAWMHLANTLLNLDEAKMKS